MLERIIDFIAGIRHCFCDDEKLLCVTRQGKEFEVWGYDTYSHESYFCGSFDVYKDAERLQRKLERNAYWTQRCKELRDTFCIIRREDM